MYERITIDPNSDKAPDVETTENPEVTTEETTEVTTDRPEWLPEKFKSPEALAEAYAELERKISSNTPEAPSEDVGDVKSVVTAAGVDFDAMQTEYNTNGELSEATYTRLSEAGFPKGLVDGWIAGQKALATQATNNILSEVGGEKVYAKATEWAATNLSEGERAAYNKVVANGTVDEVVFAMKGLIARSGVTEVTTPPPSEKMVDGSSSTAGVTPYGSVDEFKADMRNQAYSKDASFRAKVDARLRETVKRNGGITG